MEALSFEKRKISLAQTILALNDTNKMFRIQTFIQEVLTDISEQKTQKQENEYDAKLLSFEQWNEQFDDEYNLNDFIPEYGMTIRDFRLQIYNSEQEQGMSKKAFFEKVKNLK